MISGFVIVYMAHGRDLDGRSLMRGRIARVVLLYFVATLLILSLFAIGYRPAGLHDFDLGDVAASLLFLPGIRADGIPGPIVSVGWTLNYEMLFYVVFAGTLFLKNAVMSGVVLTAIFLTLAVAGAVAGPVNLYVAHATNPITLEFAAGCLLALAHLRRRDRPAGRADRLLGVALVAAGIGALLAGELAGLDPYGAEMAAYRVFYFGIPSVLIVAGALLLEPGGRVVRSPTLLLLGAANYAIYLFHMFALQPTTRIVAWLFSAGGLPVPFSRCSPGWQPRPSWAPSPTCSWTRRSSDVSSGGARVRRTASRSRARR